MIGIQEQRLKLKPICVLDWSSQCYAAALRYVTGILTSRCGHVWTMAWQCVVPGHLCGLGDYLTEKSLESPRPQEAWDSHGFVATDSMVSILRYSWCLSESIQTSASHDNNLAACRAQPERSVVWNSHSLNSVCVHWHFSMTSLDIFTIVTRDVCYRCLAPQLVPKQPTILAASLFISHCWTFSEKCMIWVKYLGMVCSLCSYYARRKIHNVSQCYISVYSVIYMRMMYAVQMIIITYNHLSSYKYICV